MVLAQVVQHGPVSRKRVSEALDLRLPTVNEHIRALALEGFVCERLVATGRRGRRPGLLEFNAGARTAVGVSVQGDSLWVVATDLSGKTRFPAVRAGASYSGRDELYDAIVSAARMHLRRVRRKEVLGIGIAVPGTVDTERGVSLTHAKTSWWRDVPLSAPLSRKLRVPVHVENDTNATALAEVWFGDSTGCKDFLFVELSDGIGATLIRKGDLDAGAFGTAGEMGHMTIDMAGRKCSCGSRGCLETLVGARPILRATGMMRVGDLSLLKALDKVRERARSGEKKVIDAIADMGRAFGIGLAGVVNLIEPARVILYGELLRLAPWFDRPMTRAFRTHVLAGPKRKTPILLSKMSDDAAALGAAALVVHKRLHL